MKAKFIWEALDFERGLNPKTSMDIGRNSLMKKDFNTEDEAIGWAIRNLHILTGDLYSDHDSIRMERSQFTPENNAYNMPRPIIDGINNFLDSAKIRNKRITGVNDREYFLSNFYDSIRNHGILHF